MRDADRMRELLERLDGRGYKAYKDLEGAWAHPAFELRVDHVQGDPFADPSRLRVLVPAERAGLEPSAFTSGARRLGVAAHLARVFATTAREASRDLGSGKSGRIHMEHPGQVVLPQTAVRVDAHGGVEARFTVGLPARGRRIAGREAIDLMTRVVPTLVRDTLLAGAHDAAAVERAADVNEDADALRAQLAEHGLVAWVADDASLPRRSGVDDRPMHWVGVQPFASPGSLAVTLTAPNAGPLRGMGVAEGVTLVVGGGFHGKSTLLRALQSGVWNHRPGDGRERVVTRADAVKVRAEDGRRVAGVDISAFIGHLPSDDETDYFVTPNASGSTSQAAAIAEAVEAGSRLLLLDEDTSATNFMIRDRRMQELVPAGGEPITPFVDRVRALYETWGVSTVLVVGGSGDYLDVADRVVRMADYVAVDVTPEARAVAERFPTGRSAGAPRGLRPIPDRVPDPDAIDARRGRRSVYVRAPDPRTLLFGEDTIDVVALEQLAGSAQLRSVGLALALLARRMPPEGRTISEALDDLEDVVAREGLDALGAYPRGDLAGFRRYEVAAALNRLRALRVRQAP